ncbi:hypothetical protein OROGR_021575 [Orobanche gracilis]
MLAIFISLKEKQGLSTLTSGARFQRHVDSNYKREEFRGI